MPDKKQILFIEDDKFISGMYLRAFVNAGYEVDVAETGQTGINKARSKHYDLILLDIWIPDKNGIEVLEELRGPDGTGLESSKIIITTNYAQDEEAKRALAAQADGYFIKAEITPRKMVQIAKDLIG